MSKDATPRAAHWPAPELAALAARRERVLAMARERMLGTGVWDTSTRPATNPTVNDIGKHWWPRLIAELVGGASPEREIVQRPATEERPAVVATVGQIVHGLVWHEPQIRPAEKLFERGVGYLYFSPVGIGWLVACRPDLLAPTDWQTVAGAILQPPAILAALNCLTGEGTENHILMGRTGGWLVVETILRRGPTDAVTGGWYDQALAAHGLLEEYFGATLEAMERLGVGEYDSSTYYPYVLACWHLLHHATRDEAMRGWSQRALDVLYRSCARRWSWGIWGGVEQRGGGATAPLQSNLDAFLWLPFGSPEGAPAEPAWRGPDWGQMVYAAIDTGYLPRWEWVVEARKAEALLETVTHDEVRPSYVCHGDLADPALTRLCFHVDRNFTLGAAVARPTCGWTGGDNQDVLWKFVGRPRPGEAAMAASGPTGRHPFRQVVGWGTGLVDGWWFPENFEEIQAEAMTIITGHPDGSGCAPGSWRARAGEDQLRRFPGQTARQLVVTPRPYPLPPVVTPEVLLPERESGVWWQTGVRDGNLIVFGRAALWVRWWSSAPMPSRPNYSSSPDAARRFGLRWHLPRGAFGGWLIEAIPMPDAPDIEQALAEIARRLQNEIPPLLVLEGGQVSFVTWRKEALRFAYQTAGGCRTVEYDWGFGATQLGGYPYPAQPPFQYPQWPKGHGWGRVGQLARELWATNAAVARFRADEGL